jgi:hypothetical protein
MGVIGSLTGGTDPDIGVSTSTQGKNDADEVYHIAARDQYHLQTALDRVRPVTSYPTIGEAAARRQVQNWTTVTASSEYNEVVRYVTGNPSIQYPEPDSTHWIEDNIEKAAPRIPKDLQYHYAGWHAIANIAAYTDAALDDPDYANDSSVLANYKSQHVGQFGIAQRRLSTYTYLSENKDDLLVFGPDRVQADYFEPLTITTRAEDGTSLINGIYATDYVGNPSAPVIKYAEEQFWASTERQEGADYLEIDLGQPCAVNYLVFEISRKPIDIEVTYDTLDQAPRRNFVGVTPIGEFPSSVNHFATDPNPWVNIEFGFENAIGQIPFTRFVRLKLERQSSDLQPFLYDPVTQTQEPWSIEVRNLRIGRNVSDY